MGTAVRPPVVAGMFYPGSRAALAKEVDGYLAGALPPVLDRVRAVIAPHAGYVYSGPTAGYAFKSLQSGVHVGRTTVYLMGPSHRAWFDGVATGDFHMSTPLGLVPTDVDRVRALWALGTHYHALPETHREEHCLEVQVPFLQRVIPDLQLVPLLFGEVDACAVGRELANVLRDDPDARLVVSSDLSHYNDYASARRMDQAFLRHVLEGKRTAVEQDRHGACGRVPIVSLMQIASELGWKPHLLDYRTSGDTAGDKVRVVGYGAVAFTEAVGG